MNLVVVYLTKVREHVIIPENYIHGFNLKALKNFGKNACRDQLVYWSDECIEGENYPDPKEDAIVSETWPAGSGAWYHARTIYYTDDIVEAKKIKENRRKVLPGVYNPLRLKEKPLPMLALSSKNEQQQSDDSVEEESVAIGPLHASSTSHHSEVSIEHGSSPNSSVLDASTTTIDYNDNLEVAVEQHSNGSDASSEWAFVTDSSNESDASYEWSFVTDKSADLSNANVKEEPIFVQLADDNAQVIENVINHSFEQCDEEGEVLVRSKDILPMPIGERNAYEMKQNDIISGNMAFAKNVSIFIIKSFKNKFPPILPINVFYRFFCVLGCW